MTVMEKAYAKINLFLDVTGRREDGYHDVSTLMHSVDLCDEITLTAKPSDKNSIVITSSDEDLETNENNLIYKSALKYLSYFNIFAKVDVELIKRIPIGAGLGGGSADAAATLRALNRIYGLATKDQLYEMAAELGSDVPFCLVGGAAVCSGRGEKITPFQCSLTCDIVIAIGEMRVSTPKAYALLDEKYGDFKEHTRQKITYDIQSTRLYNIFESVIKLDEIDEIKRIMTENSASQTLMSGSGPSVFGLFDNAADAEAARYALANKGFSAYRCKIIKENI